MKVSRLFVIATALLMAGIAAASNPVGHWKGKIHLDASKMPQSGGNTEQNKKFMAQMKSMMEKMTILLDIKKDHTFSVQVNGGPNSNSKKEQHGTWSQKGDMLTLTDSNEKSSKHNSQNFRLSHNGKILTLESAGVPGNVTFTRS